MTRYRRAVLEALAALEAELEPRVAITAAMVAARLVGTQSASSVQRILRALEHAGFAEEDRARHGRNGATAWEITDRGTRWLETWRDAPR